jgi:O-antigen biosynthesis protein
MPLVWQQDPSIACLLVGSDMPERVKLLAQDGVEIVGQVDALAEIFERVRLTVAPLRYGAGVKGKVLESFAAGIPCVMSKVAAEGIPLSSPLDQLVGADAGEIAARIVHMHSDELAAFRASNAGLSLIESRHSERYVAETLRTAIDGRPPVDAVR